MYMKEQVEAGYVGEVMSCHVTLMRHGVLERTSDRTWQRDAELGANTLTIANGHMIDAMRFVAGDFAAWPPWWLPRPTSGSTPAPGRRHFTRQRAGQRTAADGAVASVHVAAIPFAGSDYRMEIYGREGTLVATAGDLPQLGTVHLAGREAATSSSGWKCPRASPTCARDCCTANPQRGADVHRVRRGHPHRPEPPADV